MADQPHQPTHRCRKPCFATGALLLFLIVLAGLFGETAPDTPPIVDELGVEVPQGETAPDTPPIVDELGVEVPQGDTWTAQETLDYNRKRSEQLRLSQTPTPTREPWTAQELLDCDKTTLNRQLDDRALPGELLSDCEVEFYTAQLHLAAVGEDELTPSERAILLEHLANLDEIHREVNAILERGIVYANVVYSCSLLPKWLSWIQAAEAHLESLGRTDLLAYEVEILNSRLFIDGIQKVCQDAP